MKWEGIWAKAKEERASKPRKQRSHTESRLQESCVTWFRLQFPALAPLLFAVPNGGSRSHRTVVRGGKVYTYSPEAMQLRREGLTAGVADLILLMPSPPYASLCIEMKTTEKSSKQRECQKEWQRTAEAHGNKYVICRTIDEFRHAVLDYLPKTQ